MTISLTFFLDIFAYFRRNQAFVKKENTSLNIIFKSQNQAMNLNIPRSDSQLNILDLSNV